MVVTVVEKAAPAASAGPGSDFAGLTREVARAGLLARRPGYYALRAAAAAALLGTAWAAVLAIGDSWWQVPVAALLAVAAGQLALLAHDIAHRPRRRRCWSRTPRCTWARC